MRKVMVEVQCSRCDRKETVEYDPQKDMGQTPAEPPAVLTAVLRNQDGTLVKVGFEDLCGPCHRSVRGLLEQIGKRIEGMSPDRAPRVKAKKEEPAPPPAPAPRSPPQPVAKSAGRSS